MKKKILAIILARSKSKGLKDKNIKKINKIPLLGLAARVSSKCKLIERTIISTDSTKYGKIAESYGAEFFFKRSKVLSGDLVNDEKVLIDGLIRSEKYFNTKYDFIISLPASTATRQKKDLDLMIDYMIKNKFTSLWSLSETDTKYHPLKQVVLNKKKLKFYEKGGHKIFSRQQIKKKIYHRNGVAYIIERNALLKKGKLMTTKTGGFILKGERISIDNMEDFKRSANILSK